MRSDREVEYRPYPKLTPEFILENIRPTWSDLRWAAANHWLSGGALEMLADTLAGDDDDLRVRIAIAADEGEHLIRELIEEQAAAHPISEERLRGRWMFIAAAWVYANRAWFADPFTVTEEIWEAFDHPGALDCLVRWLPVAPDEPVGESAMFDRWQSYIDRTRQAMLRDT